jgi:hypothetical protein
MFELISTYYKASEPEREYENIQCLINNLNHPLILKVHLFLQGNDLPLVSNDEKLIFIHHSKRPTFQDLFDYGNNLNPKSIRVVANSDIYFDETLKLAHFALTSLDVLALTRWDLQKDGNLEFYNNFKSQDVWIFKKFIKSDIGKFHIGRHGCDNRLVYEFKKAGYKIDNPSFSLRTIHLHQSALRTYFNDPSYERVKPPYDFLLPSVISGFKLENSFLPKYYLCRYRYFRSISNKTLFETKKIFFERLVAYILSKYYAFRLNNI